MSEAMSEAMSQDRTSVAWRAVIGNLVLLGSFALLSLGMLLLQGEGLQWRDPGVDRWRNAALVVVAWLAQVAWLRYLRRLAASRGAGGHAPVRTITANEASAGVVSGAEGFRADATVRVVYASQTGFAEQLAGQTLAHLQAAGMPARLDSLGTLTAAELRDAGHVLFVVSTTGDGDPPDTALAFSRLAMAQPAALAGLRYGLLALGDSDYPDFCGFGRHLQQWLQASGAHACFDPVEVDDGDEAALRHWQRQLGLLPGAGDLPDWQAPGYQHWQLAERRLLNPGSLGGPCFHLALQSPSDGTVWQAGDLVEIGPRQAPDKVAAWLSACALDGRVMVPCGEKPQPLAEVLARCRLPGISEIDGLDEEAVAAILQPLPHREYSIASLPEDGAIHLLVRQVRDDAGQPGLGSGWLTAHAGLGSEVALRVRSNPQFHAPADTRPLILIGNGTGLAGLRALLKARIAAGHRRNWLLFGERQAAHDFHYRDEIGRWVEAGQIERIDFAWSRDQAERIHVQQRLQEAADELRGWVAAGAAIYVCGSFEGMAPGVDAVLRGVLGTEQVDRLHRQGRYRRDVY